MQSATQTEQVLLIPCSGIGKVHGLISREAVYKAADTLGQDQADTVCLALLGTGDPDTRRRVQEQPCVTLDGCPKLCAQKNVELSGGKVAQAVRVYDTLKRHRGGKFGSATALTDEGRGVVDEIAAEVVETARAAAAN